MSPRRYALKKDANQEAIVDALEAIGCSVWVQHEPCDLLVGFRESNFLLEVKNPDAPAPRLTPAQVRFRSLWRGQFAVVWSVDEALAAVSARAT